MKLNLKLLFSAAVAFFALPLFLFAQTPQTIKRTTTKVERVKLGLGGSVTVLGAPEGSIVIEAWQQSDVEVTAEIENTAANEADLAILAAVNNFTITDEPNRVGIVTTGIHDKKFLKKNFKSFPKRLLNSTWRVDYRIKVPAFCDLEINAGRGRFSLSGVEGIIVIKAADTEEAELNLTGGVVRATFGGGTVNVNFSSRSWRGSGAEIQLAKGEMNVNLPPNLNADVDAEILRIGSIENLFPALKPLERTKFSPTKIQARAGNGGAVLLFTVGDGTLRLRSAGEK